MPTAIVNFRTKALGAYKWIRPGMRRGYWRVLVVQDPTGSTRVNSHNVLRVLYKGPEGLDGTTSRSAYHIGRSYRTAMDLAAHWNLSNGVAADGERV